MKVVIPTFFLAAWSLYVWVFDPFHIQDRLPEMGSFFYWLIGAVLSVLLGMVIISIWGKR